ncbi:MAG: ATP-binding protein [bacterium]
MKPLGFRTVLYLCVDLIILILCFNHIPKILDRPGIPFEVAQGDLHPLVAEIIDSSACRDAKAGDTILRWEEVEVHFPEMIEYLADVRPLHSSIRCTFLRGDSSFTTSIRLIEFYQSSRFLVISLIVGLCIFFVGVFVLLTQSDKLAARVTHWMMVSFGTTIMITWGAAPPGSWEMYISRTIWFMAYLGVAVSFLIFGLSFPVERVKRLAQATPWIMIAVLCVGFFLGLSHIKVLETADLSTLNTFQLLFDLFHSSLFLFSGGGFYFILSSTRQNLTMQERKQLFWILWGLGIGILPYLIVHILPQIIFSQVLVPEEYTTICFLAVPVSFAIAFLRYQLLDIELLINRTIVYSILSFIIVVIYVLTVLLTVSMVGGEKVFGKYFSFALLMLIFGLALHPFRRWLQGFVDETFFAARANYRRALDQIRKSLDSSLSREELYRHLVESVHQCIPTNAVDLYRNTSDGWEYLAGIGMKPPDKVQVPDKIQSALNCGMIIRGVKKGSADLPELREIQEWLGLMKWSLCIPICIGEQKLFGILTLTPHVQTEIIQDEEVSLLETVCAHTRDILDRLILQEQILLTRQEKQRLEELNALKSYFVSSISHELRMPLTSIRMFAETLMVQRNVSRRKQKEYLRIIYGESERLSRLIGNIMDFAKIERGMREYKFVPLSIEGVTHRALKAIEYEVKKHKARVRVAIQKKLPAISADPDALEQAILNLLSNALKYSKDKSEINLKACKEQGHLLLEISDTGFGIPSSESTKIFERFYRISDDRSCQVGGAGLGLSLVKHIVDAHQGTITVESAVGVGSKFTMRFPITTNKARRHP